MGGHVILSHGSDSSPEATKVAALARVAEHMGFTTERPDYRACDAAGHAGSVAPRIEQLHRCAQAATTAPILVGSSMGAFVSGPVSRQVRCRGLFLLALPVAIPGCAQAFDMADDMRAMLVHGFADDVCPPDATVKFAGERGTPTLLLDDGHRLAEHVPVIEQQFRLFLENLSA